MSKTHKTIKSADIEMCARAHPEGVSTRAKLPEDKAATVRLLGGRIRQAREQLGMLDYDRARLEAQAAQVRAKLAQDLAEMEGTIESGAKAVGLNLSDPGWRFDLATGEFSR